MDLFSEYKGKKFGMQDETVENPDKSESVITPLEPDENATAEEKDQVEVANEALAMFQGAKMQQLKKAVVAKHNKLAQLATAIADDKVLSKYVKNILMEEGVIDPGDMQVIGDSAAEDAKEAVGDVKDEPIADKGATEEELVKHSQMCIKAQCNALKAVYKAIMSV